MNPRIKIIGYTLYCLFSLFFLPTLIVKFGGVIGIDLNWCIGAVWITTQFATCFIGAAVFIDEKDL